MSEPLDHNETSSSEHDLWIRVADFCPSLNSSDRVDIRILVPLQPHHIVKRGVPKQEMLVGRGRYDVCRSVPKSVNDEWSFVEAIEHCIDELTQKKPAEKDRAQNTSELFIQLIESLADVKLAEPCIAPTGLLVQEIIVPETLWTKLLSKSESTRLAYQLLWEMGLQAMTTESLDSQPRSFVMWFQSAIVGNSKPPSKRPKAWATEVQNHHLCSLVRVVCQHGFSPTRNDVSPKTSACDVVAEACLKSGVRGVSSYETVRKIYYKYHDRKVGKIII